STRNRPRLDAFNVGDRDSQRCWRGERSRGRHNLAPSRRPSELFALPNFWQGQDVSNPCQRARIPFAHSSCRQRDWAILTYLSWALGRELDCTQPISTDQADQVLFSATTEGPL